MYLTNHLGFNCSLNELQCRNTSLFYTRKTKLETQLEIVFCKTASDWNGSTFKKLLNDVTDDRMA